MQAPAPETPALSEADTKRQQFIANTLASQLDRMFSASKAHDAKPLTDGEVITALGMLIGTHCTTSAKITNWITGIQLVANQVHAAKGSPK